MGNLAETLRKNIDAVAVAAACLAVFLGSHSVCPRVSVPRIAFPSAIHAVTSDAVSQVQNSIEIRLRNSLCR